MQQPGTSVKLTLTVNIFRNYRGRKVSRQETYFCLHLRSAILKKMIFVRTNSEKWGRAEHSTFSDVCNSTYQKRSMEIDPLSISSSKCFATNEPNNNPNETGRFEHAGNVLPAISPDFICFVCNNEFDDMAKLHVHMSLKHKGIKVCCDIEAKLHTGSSLSQSTF